MKPFIIAILFLVLTTGFTYAARNVGNRCDFDYQLWGHLKYCKTLCEEDEQVRNCYGHAQGLNAPTLGVVPQGFTYVVFAYPYLKGETEGCITYALNGSGAVVFHVLIVSQALCE